MKKVIRFIPKVISKLFAMMLSPVLHLFNWAARIVAFLLSYACIGLSLICLIGAVAEFINIGVSKDAFAYLALAALSYVARWVILRVVPFLFMLQDYVDARAESSLRGESYDYFDGNYDGHYSHL